MRRSLQQTNTPWGSSSRVPVWARARILAALKGADAHCTKLAEAAGSTGRTWRAYLSTQVEEGRAISARDRIGSGPWYNARGELIAVDLDQLHINPNIVKRTALDENGNLVNGRGDRPNQHDILTGTKDDGTAYFPWQEGDHTCNNWTSSGEGSARVGHHDRHGGWQYFMELPLMLPEAAARKVW